MYMTTMKKTLSDYTAAEWAEAMDGMRDAITRTMTAGDRLRRAEAELKGARAEAAAAARQAAGHLSEVEIARHLGASRTSVRKWIA